jgi:DNA-binding NtrC family response regulator
MAVLVVDDDKLIRRSVELMCRHEDFQLKFAANGLEAIELLEEQVHEINLVLSDIMMPLMGGEALLSEVRARYPHLPVVVMTSFGSIDDAVKFLKLGAADYITKPFRKEVLLHRINAVLGRTQLVAELTQLREELAPRNELDDMIGQSPAFLDILKNLPTIAKTEASVIVYGESGTGKELIAKAVHRLSPRHKQSFVTLNCGALPENLLESELFGYQKGAFTGATKDHKGLASEADGGSLFLDEIGEISPSFQVKLLRFLQEKEYRPLGSRKTLYSDVRFISATHRDLQAGISEGTFREDLFYRLNIIPIQLPPLRNRKEDIPLLADHFLKVFGAQMEKPGLSFSNAALENMQAYPWPGNIRQLKNKLLQVVVMCNQQTITPELIDLPFEEGQQSEPMVPKSTTLGTFKEEKSHVVQRFEERYISQMLKIHKGNVTRAAKAAGMDRKNFWQKMKKYSLKGREFA